MSDFSSMAEMPPAVREYFRAIYERATERFATAANAHGNRPGFGRALAEARVALLDETLAPIFPAMAEAGSPIACAKGCTWCCSSTVEVTPDEVFALVEYLEARLEPVALAAVKSRAAAADARGHGVPSIERHQLRIFCPVLDPATGACLGHAVRPAPCQGYLSINLALCEADYQRPPGVVQHPQAAALTTGVVSGTRDALLDDLGLPRPALELTAALAVAWRTENAERRWLDGENLFADALYVRSDPVKFTPPGA